MLIKREKLREGGAHEGRNVEKGTAEGRVRN